MSRNVPLIRLAAYLLVAFVGCNVAAAADPGYPTRPVRLIVAFPPGGGVDLAARMLAPKLTTATGQTWIVDNRAGAGGNVGAEIVVRSQPDGYTVINVLNTQLTANPSLYRMSFNVEKELQPVTVIAVVEHWVVINPGIPAKTFAEFIAYVKQKPGALNYGSAGIGSSNHLAGALLVKRTGIQMSHVAYKGAGPSITALLSGETQMLTVAPAGVIGHIQAGKLRALATMSLKHSKLLPDLPMVAELGYPGFEAGAWYALLVPTGTPDRIVERIRTETLKAIDDPEVQTSFQHAGFEPATSTPAELAARIKAESAMYSALIKDAGIRAE